MSAYCKTSGTELSRCITSCFDQKCTSVAVDCLLFIDGPIGPELSLTLESLSTIYGSRLIITRSPINVGLARALNALINNHWAAYDYLLRIDTDDFNLPGRLASQIGYLEENKHVDVLGGAILEARIDRNGEIQRQVVTFPTAPDMLRTLPRRSPVAHPTVCFRASLFSNAMHRYPDIQLNEDIAFWFALIGEGVVFDNLKQPLVEFKFDDNSLRRRGALKAFAEYKVYKEGVKRLGFPWYQRAFPMFRFLFRLMPYAVANFAYKYARR